MYIEHKGRTLHLLKAKSKPVPQQRKRRKIELLGTFDQFKQSQEEFKQEESEAEMIMAQTQQVHSLSRGTIMQDPNQ